MSMNDCGMNIEYVNIGVETIYDRLLKLIAEKLMQIF